MLNKLNGDKQLGSLETSTFIYSTVQHSTAFDSILQHSTAFYRINKTVLIKRVKGYFLLTNDAIRG